MLRKSIEEWRAAKASADWAFQAAKILHGWPIGRVLSESEYDAAIRAVERVQLSSPTLQTRRTAPRF